MGNFAEQLKESAFENSRERKDERIINEILIDLYESIKDKCTRHANEGATSCRIQVAELLRECVENHSDWRAEELFFKSPGEGYEKSPIKVFVDSEKIKSYLEKCFEEDGLKIFRFEEKEVNQYSIEKVYVENSNAVKVLSLGAKLFFDNNIEVEGTMKRKRTKIGTITKDFIYVLEW